MENSFNQNPKRHYVRQMFDSIAHRYDLINHVLSLGLHVRWRSFAVNKLNLSGGERIIDVASGTGSFSIITQKFKPSLIFGVDVSLNMLKIYRQRALAKGIKNLNLLCAEAETLPFKDEVFDVCLVAFGVRNFADPKIGLSEIYRVMKQGGKLAVLEISIPNNPLIKLIYLLYLKKILPLIGGLLSKYKSAYEYLSESVSAFPQGKHFAKFLSDLGFREVKIWNLTFGVVKLYIACK